MINDDATRAWKEGVAAMINYFHDRTEGSWIEERHSSLVFRYANAEDKQTAERHGPEQDRTRQCRRRYHGIPDSVGDLRLSALLFRGHYVRPRRLSVVYRAS